VSCVLWGAYARDLGGPRPDCICDCIHCDGFFYILQNLDKELLIVACSFMQAVLETVARVTHDKPKKNDTQEVKYVSSAALMLLLLSTYSGLLMPCFFAHD
jgi:hypothetical protein